MNNQKKVMVAVGIVLFLVGVIGVFQFLKTRSNGDIENNKTDTSEGSPTGTASSEIVVSPLPTTSATKGWITKAVEMNDPHYSPTRFDVLIPPEATIDTVPESGMFTVKYQSKDLLTVFQQSGTEYFTMSSVVQVKSGDSGIIRGIFDELTGRFDYSNDYQLKKSCENADMLGAITKVDAPCATVFAHRSSGMIAGVFSISCLNDASALPVCDEIVKAMRISN